MQNENKRIARNTLLLYIRMIAMVIISLYTSRIVLKVLGEEDFGIYNVVGGIISFLGFLTSSLAGAASRFITYALGKEDNNNLKKTFNNIILIHLLFAGLILIVGETIGLWFIKTQLNIPPEREYAAMWVYQMSVFTAMGGLICAPFNSVIIAHEKMSTFAYLSLSDAILKLVSVFILLNINYDKLIFYSIYIFIIQVFDFALYIIYCKYNFEETKRIILTKIDKNLFKEIFFFAGWTMSGSLAYFGFTQGLNILLNIFFNPIINAARGIAVQVQNIVNTFNNNFLMAINPQITKKYAAGDYLRVKELIINSSRFSLYLMLLICIPLFLEVNLILHWWLGEYPQHTDSFLRLILITSILSCLANPIITTVHATGRMKKFQLIESSILLTIVPIAYFCLKLDTSIPEIVFFIHICIEIIAQCARLKIVLPMINMTIKEYTSAVMKKIIIVILLAPILPIIIYYNTEQNFLSFISICITSTISILFCIYTLGLDQHERNTIKEVINKKIYHRQKNKS